MMSSIVLSAENLRRERVIVPMARTVMDMIAVTTDDEKKKGSGIGKTG